jgi:glycine oxidase
VGQAFSLPWDFSAACPERALMSSPDVIIVGGGIIGCSVAWRLAQRGVSVAIFEAGRIGSEASWAGAGMLAPGGEVEGPSAWALRSIESVKLYPAFLAELQEESGITADFRACGAVEASFSEAEFAAGEDRAIEQQKLGITSERLSSDDVLARMPHIGTASLTGGFFYPGDAVVDPREVVDGLRVACERRGVRIEEGRRVRTLDELKGATVVVAAGAWAGELDPSLPRSFPVKGHLIGYQVRPGSLGPIVRRGHTYILQRSNGFTIAGSTTEHAGFDRSVSASTVQSLHRRAHELIPSLLISSPDESWIGFRPGADEPHVGRFGDAPVWLAYGHYRNGILLAPVTAQLVADEITAS